MRLARARAFWSLLSTVALLAVAVTVYASSHLELPAALWFFVAAAILAASPARLYTDVEVSLVILADLLAVMYGGLPMALVTSLAAGAVTVARINDHRLIKGGYNAATFVLAGAASAAVFSAIAGTPLEGGAAAADTLANLRWVPGLLGAALASVAVNVVLIAGALVTTVAVPLRNTVNGMARQLIVVDVMYAGLAGIAFLLLAEVHPITLLLLLVPLLVARRALQATEERHGAFDRMVKTFVKAIEVKDGYTRGHAERVADLSVAVAAEMGLTYEERRLVRYGALLHDVGKIGVSLGVLCKAGPLDDREFAEMKQHPEIGAEILDDIDFLKPALAIVRHHHERLDGDGYPDGIAGEEIPLLTRIVTAVDAFDAMTSTRSYRRALPIDVALAELERCAGDQFDPEVVELLVKVVREHGWQLTDEPVAVAAGGERAHEHVLLVHAVPAATMGEAS